MLIDNIPVSRGPDGWCVVLLGLAIEHKARAFPCGTQYSRHSGLLVELFIFIFFEGGDDRGGYRNREFIKHGIAHMFKPLVLLSCCGITIPSNKIT